MPEFNRIDLITSSRFYDHFTGLDHPESPDRIKSIIEKLKKGTLQDNIKWTDPRLAGIQDIKSIHKNNYLLRFEEACLSGREYFMHTDNRVCYDTFEIAFLAAGACLTGIDLIETKEAKLPFCLIRPPGHHAEPSLALGFCFLNNVAIATRYWQAKYKKKRIFIIDWDAHHGNGIQEVFDEDPDVFYVSIHEHPTFSFPGTGYADENGNGAGKGTTLNIPLPPSSGEKEVLHALDNKVAPSIEAFRPDAMIVAAGFDGHIMDDMSGLSYTTRLYGYMGNYISAWAEKFCAGNVLTVLEGGYNMDVLGASVETYLAGLALILS